MSTPPPNPYGQPPQYGYPQPQPQPPAYGTPAPAYAAPPPPYGTPQPTPGQPAYGQPAPGQPAYGQPVPGQPMPGQPPYGQPQYPQQQQYPPRPTDSQRKSRRRRALLLLTGCLAALGLLMYFSQSSPDNAHVNDCVHATGSNSIEKVSCTDAKADMIVLARYNGTTSTSRCNNIPNLAASYWGSYGRRWHKTRYVLCLGRHVPGAPARSF